MPRLFKHGLSAEEFVELTGREPFTKPEVVPTPSQAFTFEETTDIQEIEAALDSGAAHSNHETCAVIVLFYAEWDRLSCAAKAAAATALAAWPSALPTPPRVIIVDMEEVGIDYLENSEKFLSPFILHSPCSIYLAYLTCVCPSFL